MFECLVSNWNSLTRIRWCGFVRDVLPAVGFRHLKARARWKTPSLSVSLPVMSVNEDVKFSVTVPLICLFAFHHDGYGLTL